MTAASSTTGVAVGRRSITWGVVATAAIAVFYALVVGLASGSVDHLLDQARRDWYLLAAIVVGFGVQVALVVELRYRHRLSHGALAAGSTGTGASAVGMIACCAHHLADLLPVLGATGAAAFLLDWRVPFMLVGIVVNAVGITAAVRRLARAGSPPAHRKDAACAAA